VIYDLLNYEAGGEIEKEEVPLSEAEGDIEEGRDSEAVDADDKVPKGEAGGNTGNRA
jgi:hypothetical protein